MESKREPRSSALLHRSMKPVRLFPCLALAVLPALASRAADPTLTAQGDAVVVPAGEYHANGHVLKVTQAATLHVAPAPILTATDEPFHIIAEKPAFYAKGSGLPQCRARDVFAGGSDDPSSIEIRRTKGGALLKLGDDYRVDAFWPQVWLGPQSTVKPEDTVFVSYRYSQLRMDTIQVAADGTASLKQGQPRLTAPVPADPDAGHEPLAHVWINYRDQEVKADQIYLVEETPRQAITASTPGRIPKTLAKLQAGQPVKIVCWGDSVTAGGNASKPETRYVDVFAAGLRSRFPNAKIDVENISAGGSNSRQWLSPEQHPYRGLKGKDNPARFEHVIEAKPDLVTLEFVNDAGLSPAQVESQYSEILQRLEPTGAELILITPHFTMLKMMGFQTMRETEKRPYVAGLHEFAEKHHLALADASARWQHLAKEGIPYLTLLDNTINHPDDRGHRLFAEELWKCFK